MADSPFRRLREAIDGVLDRLRGKTETVVTDDSPLTWPNDERHRVAMHEAGHGIVAWSMTTVAEVSSIAVNRGGNGMTVWAGDAFLHNSRHPLALWERCSICFGGIAAEAHAYGNYYRNASADDLRKAWEVSEYLALLGALRIQVPVSPWGEPPAEAMSDIANMFPWPVPSLQAKVLLAAYCRARAVTAANQENLRILAKAAATRRLLNADDIAKILGPRPWAIIR